ncbi:zinc-dependent alcohol dehydrogenase [Aliarcobacter cibarius]|uniref:Zinc-dependent alcohol dehydrogenase n=1 Tax=Aliarcobacter cibarius TaxID=255507 RepID=A0A7L5JM84_9BACT|nr:alcohol dehydrogenase catalytic domain-containing protein [Aliarcobacter cibarius]QKJ26247.1 zinc-dependent alcohol dehydrogenase [Aliarcobacter cibarius]
MKTAIYYGPKDIRCGEKETPIISNKFDIKVKVLATSICGSDLHLYRGSLDLIMERGVSQTGHELCGEVLEIGTNVSKFKVGDRISMAYSCSCGHCYMCECGQTAHCETTNKSVYGFGIPFGNLNGTHTEEMIISHAEAHSIIIPEEISDVAALTLSCNMPSAIIANELANIKVGEKVAIIGAGPTGLMSLDIALTKTAAKNILVVEPIKYRREFALKKGVNTIDPNSDNFKEDALKISGIRGFDKIIEMVGHKETLQMAFDLIRAGGTISALGVFTDQEFNLILNDVFLRDISLHMNGFANVQPYMKLALKYIQDGIVNPDEYFSHEFNLDDIDQAFKLFNNKEDNVMKILIKP